MKKHFFTYALFIFCISLSGKVFAQDAFITTWQTTDGSITIPIISVDSLTYNYNIEWTNLTNPGAGDGSETGVSTAYTISSLNNTDIYEIKISGAFPAIFFNNGTEKDKIQTLEQWGDIEWATMYLAFYGCTNLTSNATDAPNLQFTTSLYGMFAGATSFNSDLNNWDVSTITDMYAMFFQATSFNSDISDWDVSNVLNMYAMFYLASSFNSDISNWNVSQVTNMGLMFSQASDFNSDISSWYTGNVTNMSAMFSGAISFNRNLNDWSVGAVLNMSGMFQNATAFNSELNYWYTGNVTNMSNMFSGASSFNQSLGNWSIGNVTTMANMLDNCGMSKLNYDATLRGWESSFSTPIGITLGAAGLIYCNAADTRAILTGTGGYSWIINGDNLQCDPFITTWQTFDGEITIPTPTFGADPYFYSVSWVNLTTTGAGDGSATGITGDFTIAQLNSGDTYQVSISGDFPRIYFSNFNLTADDRAKILTIEQWGDQEWTNMSNAFGSCINLISNATDSPLLNKATVLYAMFSGATSFTGDLSNWDVSTINDMSNMFQNASSFNGNLNTWDVSNVIDMSSMFRGASSFNSDLNNWNVSNVNYMSSMFSGATSFNGDVSTWQLNNVISMNGMFAGAISFNGNLSDWSVNNVSSMSSMFSGAISFNGDLSDWNVGNANNMNQMFAGATAFNKDLSGWDVRNVTEMNGMFEGATSFNQDLSNWDVAKVRNMGGMFWNATSFNQSLGDWDISSIVPFEEESSGPPGIDSLFTNSGLSTFNYDSTLIGWATLSTGETQVPSNLNLGAQNLNFCLSDAERAELIENFGWTILDNGAGCPMPSLQATDITFTDVGLSQMNISWINGDGTRRLVVAKEGSSVNTSPADLTTYAASATFDNGDEIGSGNFVVYNGSANSFTLQGLSQGTTYHLRVYEYNGLQGTEVYNLAAASGNPASAETLAVPSITSFTPTAAAQGDTVVIEGTNFSGATVVRFGGIDASNFSIVSGTEISAIVGSGSSGSVRVTTPGGAANLSGFEFIPAPTITSYSPSPAAQGDTVVIVGTNFSDATKVSFGGTDADDFTIISSTEIRATIGTGTSGNIEVTTAGGTATIAGFEFIPAPTIILFTPTIAAQGDEVIIAGANFTGATMVSFGEINAMDFSVISNTEIRATVGTGATGDVKVVTPGGTATRIGFEFIPAPTISSFTPTSAAKGTVINIAGTNFTGATTVSFGGSDAASFSVVSDSEISATIGAGASGVIMVSTPGGTATLAGFEFIPAPTITSFTPTSAAQGEAINIEGTNFTGTTIVSFGGTNAADFSVISDTEISATIGSGASGVVMVSSPGGTATKEGFSFTTTDLTVYQSDNTLIENNQSAAVNLGTAISGETIEYHFILENTGSANLEIFDISSTNSAFGIKDTPSFIPSGATAQFTVELIATEIGLYSSNIRISNNSENAADFLFPVVAELLEVNIIDNETESVVISNENIDLGSTIINVNIDKTFKIENRSSNSSLEILNITVDNPVFEIIDPPTTINSQSSAEFTVSLLANTVGEYQGIVTVSTNRNEFTFQVQGAVLPEPSTEIKVYNVVTPNGDGRHDFLQIENITEYPYNIVSIFNRWGNKVFEITDYNNSTRIFEGRSDKGEELLTGNYYYVIDKSNGEKRISGFLLIKR